MRGRARNIVEFGVARDLHLLGSGSKLSSSLRLVLIPNQQRRQRGEEVAHEFKECFVAQHAAGREAPVMKHHRDLAAPCFVDELRPQLGILQHHHIRAQGVKRPPHGPREVVGLKGHKVEGGGKLFGHDGAAVGDRAQHQKTVRTQLAQGKRRGVQGANIPGRSTMHPHRGPAGAVTGRAIKTEAPSDPLSQLGVKR